MCACELPGTNVSGPLEFHMGSQEGITASIGLAVLITFHLQKLRTVRHKMCVAA